MRIAIIYKDINKFNKALSMFNRINKLMTLSGRKIDRIEYSGRRKAIMTVTNKGDQIILLQHFEGYNLFCGFCNIIIADKNFSNEMKEKIFKPSANLKFWNKRIKGKTYYF